ncbi:MAG: molybdenum hydroxylase, partial [Chloroflexi bacterium]
MFVNPLFKDHLILIKGAGDLASGVAFRLKRAGFPLVMTELPAPLFVRRAVCYGEAVYRGQITVDGITAQLAGSIEEARTLTATSAIPVLVDPSAEAVKFLRPAV